MPKYALSQKLIETIVKAFDQPFMNIRCVMGTVRISKAAHYRWMQAGERLATRQETDEPTGRLSPYEKLQIQYYRDVTEVRAKRAQMDADTLRALDEQRTLQHLFNVCYPWMRETYVDPHDPDVQALADISEKAEDVVEVVKEYSEAVALAYKALTSENVQDIPQETLTAKVRELAGTEPEWEPIDDPQGKSDTEDA